MQQFIDAIRLSVVSRNWYAALTLALLMPDVCGRIEDDKEATGKRYIRWYDGWVLAKYRFGDNVFLSGRDCYALRCALLHEGKSDISTQNAREVLTKFLFITPHRSMHIHCNRLEDTLQLQIDIFATDIADSVDAWRAEMLSKRADVAARLSELIEIHDTAKGCLEF